jgi:hypothetical protein
MNDQGGLFKSWTKRYASEYAVALAIYLLSVVVCVPRALAAGKPSIRVLLLMGPSAGILFMAITVIRHFLRIDEFLRHKVIEYFAISAAFTGIWTLAYGFFELAGFPRLSMWWIWPGMTLAMLSWSAVKKILRR